MFAPLTRDSLPTDSFQIVYASIGVCLYVLIMLYHTSMIIGGKAMLFVLGPETFILAATQLYLEIIGVFALLLSILGCD